MLLMNVLSGIFSISRSMAFIFSSWLLICNDAYSDDKRESCGYGYDITEFISQSNLQFCTFVEVGQGYCSIFVEFREDPSCQTVKPNSVAEVYLGTCECATMREWDLCSVPLSKSRPYECYLDDLEPSRRNGSARVHRRLCDPTKMYQVNPPCDCSASFAQRTLYPVKGFLTCYRAPLPSSICSTHSVCGVYNCAARNYFGLSLVQCDPLCLGKQPFCEELGPVTSRPPIVTSFWSEWTCPHKDESVEVSEAICIDRETNSPAFDCLGPGMYCCPSTAKDCHCEVSITMGEMKLTRFIFSDELQLGRRKRLVMHNRTVNKWVKTRSKKSLWRHLEKGLSLFGKKPHSTISEFDQKLNVSKEQQNPLIEYDDTQKSQKIPILLDQLHKRAPHVNWTISNHTPRPITKDEDQLKYMIIKYRPVGSNTAPVSRIKQEDGTFWRFTNPIHGNNSQI